MRVINYISNHIILALIIVLAAFLRLYHLNFQSIWDDEIATMIESNPNIGLGEAYHTYMNFDSMPPLYFFIVRCLFSVFGYSSLILRLFSALLGILSVFATYLLGKEIYNKSAGLLASLILSVNYFQIQYSQEGRPYTFLVLFTVLSFYSLIIYLKDNRTKNAMYYSLYTILMLYGHYFSYLILVAQIPIIAGFFVSYPKQKKVVFVKQFCFMGFIILICMIPSLPQLLKNVGVKTSWIQAPTLNVYTTFFNEFFGNSELIIPLIYIFIILFFFKLTAGEYTTSNNSELKSLQPMTLSFLVLIPWIAVTLIIPLIRSYLVLPMIISRYFNYIIPSICLIAGIGFEQIKSVVIKITLALIFVLFSLTDIFVVKDYYNKLTKAEYREASAFINQNKKDGEKIVARVGWHYDHFFNIASVTPSVVWMPFESYVSSLMVDSTHLVPFWYAAVHEYNFEQSTKTNGFFKRHFYVNKKAERFWTSSTNYQLKPSGWIELNLHDFTPIPAQNDAIFLDKNSSTKSKKISLERGNYKLIICAKSLPEESINGINAHMTFKINDKIIGGHFFPENHYSTSEIGFNMLNKTEVSFELIFDNAFYYKNQNRNVSILSIFISPN